MVEMIPHADTLRKIQVEHGVTGSFKDRTLADWLQKHNPADEQYDKVTHLCTEMQKGDFTLWRFPLGIWNQNFEASDVTPVAAVEMVITE